MNQKVTLALLLIILFMSCKMEETGHALIFSDPVSIVLQPEKSTIVLSDYFTSPEEVSIDSCPPGLNCERIDRETIGINVTGPIRPLEVLNLSYRGEAVDFLLQRSEKVLTTFQYISANANQETIAIVGDVNSWNASEGIMIKGEKGDWEKSFWLNPGLYGYQFEVDGERMLDPANPDSMDNGMGGFNSVLQIPEKSEKELPHIHTFFNQKNEPVIRVEPGFKQVKIFFGNRALNYGNEGPINLSELLNPYSTEDGFLLIQAATDEIYGPHLKIPVKSGSVVVSSDLLEPEDWHRTIMYFVMVDRFYNGNPENDQAVDDRSILPIANHFGGDLEGINKKIEEGYFSDLNFNSIWLSPIVQNPEGAWGFWDKGGVQSKFSGYHGYWPVSFNEIDYRFGKGEDLHHMVALAEEKKMSILLDLVANHVHEEHPFYRENKDKDYFTDLYLPDGTLNTERWDDHRLTTWFDTFMPTMDLSIHEVADVVSDSAVFWLEEYGVHGFRHDATKHVDLYFWRMLTEKINQLSEKTGRSYIQIGETYGTPELINSYIGPGLLDAQFDFNVYDAITQSVLRDEVSFETLASRLRQSRKYYGTNHLMGNMSGNQDKPRIMSLATKEVAFDEDTKLAGWTREINEMTGEGFEKVGMIHAINYFIPGIPVMYYGDEIGMPGGNDPDNRRMMIFDGLTSEQKELRNLVADLGKLRTERMELIYGDFQILDVSHNLLIASRNYFGSRATLILNSSDEEIQIQPEDLKIDSWEVISSFFRTSERPNSVNEEFIKIPPRQFEIILINEN